MDIAIRTRDAQVCSRCTFETGVGDKIISRNEIGKRLESGRFPVGLFLFTRKRTLPLDVARLHDLGIEHQVSVDVVNTIQVCTTCGGESRVEATGVN